MEKDRIVIGTRGSELALAQAHEVRDRLQASHGSDLLVEVEVIREEVRMEMERKGGKRKTREVVRGGRGGRRENR